MNRPVINLAGIALIALIIFLLWRNKEDEKEVEQQLKNDFHQSKEEEGDADSEELSK